MGKKKPAQGTEGQSVQEPQQQGQGQGQGQGSATRPPPAHECRIGRIRGVVWRNDGKEGPWFSVNITRSYKDGNDQWKQATSYGRDDLLVVAEVARLCWLWIASAQSNGNGGGSEGTTAVSDAPIPF